MRVHTVNIVNRSCEEKRILKNFLKNSKCFKRVFVLIFLHLSRLCKYCYRLNCNVPPINTWRIFDEFSAYSHRGRKKNRRCVCCYMTSRRWKYYINRYFKNRNWFLGLYRYCWNIFTYTYARRSVIILFFFFFTRR